MLVWAKKLKSQEAQHHSGLMACVVLLCSLLSLLLHARNRPKHTAHVLAAQTMHGCKTKDIHSCAAMSPRIKF